MREGIAWGTLGIVEVITQILQDAPLCGAILNSTNADQLAPESSDNRIPADVRLAVAAQEMPVFRARTDAVYVPVTVTDRSGRFVRGLTADQFEISEGGTRRPVVQFSAGRVPVSLGILLDISGSHGAGPGRPRGRRRAVGRHAARARSCSSHDSRRRRGVLGGIQRQGCGGPLDPGPSGILREFDGLRPGGGNALLDAVQLVLPTFELARHQRKVLLLISDGNDTNPVRQGARPSAPGLDVCASGV